MSWCEAVLSEQKKFLFRLPEGSEDASITDALKKRVDAASNLIAMDCFDSVDEVLECYADIDVEVSLTGAVPESEDDSVVDIWSPLFVSIILQSTESLTTLLMLHCKFAKRALNAIAEVDELPIVNVGDDSRFVMVDARAEDHDLFGVIAKALQPVVEQLLDATPEIKSWFVGAITAAVSAVHSSQHQLASPKKSNSRRLSADFDDVRRPMLFVDSEVLRNLCDTSVDVLQRLTQQLPLGLVVPTVFAKGEPSVLDASLCIEWQHGEALHFYAEALPFLEHVPIHSALSTPKRICTGHIAAIQRMLLATVTLQEFQLSVDGALGLPNVFPPLGAVCLVATRSAAIHCNLTDAPGQALLAKMTHVLQCGATVDYFTRMPRSTAAVFEELWLPPPPSDDNENAKMRKYKTRVELLFEGIVNEVKKAQGGAATGFIAIFKSFFLQLMPIVEGHRNDAANAQQAGDADEALDEDLVLDALGHIVRELSQSKKFSDMSLDEQFEEAQKRFGAVAGKYENNIKLRFYGLFKQATVGNVNISKPWAIDMTARAKYDAWASNKGLESEDAKRRYVSTYMEVCCNGSEPQ